MKNITISKSLKKSYPLLNIVSKISLKNRKNILKEVSNEKVIYNALHEIAYNILNKKVKLNKQQIKKLVPHQKFITKICSPTNIKCVKKRKYTVSQSGGFLGVVLPIIASIVTSALSRNV